MDFKDPAQLEVFYAIHHGLPREAPGSRACTRRALELLGPLPGEPHVLDIGCGPGMQTLDLASLLPRARITAVDKHPGYVAEAGRRVEEQGLTDRVTVIEADMQALPFELGGFDLLWCEGAAYIMGLGEALAAWKPLLHPRRGCIALTELVWLQADVPAELRRTWESSYSSMTDISGCRACIDGAGLNRVADFVLPESAWWGDYYGPMEARLDQLASVHAGDSVAESILAEHRGEIAMYREFGSYYGYVFFLMRL